MYDRRWFQAASVFAIAVTLLLLVPALQPVQVVAATQTVPTLAGHDHSTHSHSTPLVAGQTCEEQGYQTVAGQFCTHGNDPMPEMLGLSPSALQQQAQTEATTQAAAANCDGDGQSGQRIQVLYAHPVGAVDSYDYVSWAGQGWALAADSILAESARRMGGNRHFRFVHDANCNPIVEKVEVSAAAGSNFGSTIIELYQKGYNRSDRRYLVFMEAYALCGVSTVVMDDRPGSDNNNHFGVNFGRVDRYCWGGVTAAHEMMHMLGGVQDSAPNSSHGGHCTDEWDIMCYSDPPYYPQMRVVCQSTEGEQLFDCNGDDYFNPHPAPGSYLDTHWNTANNPYLIVGPDPPPCPDADHEPDHDYVTARIVAPGTTERHGFCNLYDYDVVRVNGVAGTTYRAETFNLTAGVDTILSIYLYDGFGLTYIASDNDSNGLLGSRLEYTPTANDFFYVSLSDYHFAYGSDKACDLRISIPVADTIPPTSTVTLSPAPSANGWNRGPVEVTMHGTDNEGGAGVHSIVYVSDGPVFTPSKTVIGDTAVTTFDRTGVTTLYWQAKDQNFNKEDYRTTEIRIDKRKPTANAPQATVDATTLSTGRVPVTVTWSGADMGGSGVAGYRLQRSSDSGVSWVGVPLSDLLATTATALVPNGTHLFRVRTIDGAGNLGAWVTGNTLTVEAHQERSSAISYAGTWQQITVPGAWARGVMLTSSAGATATLRFEGRTVSWVSATVPGHRLAQIRVDGVLVETLDLYSTQPKAARIVWSTTFDTSGPHTLEIRMVNSTSEPAARLAIDGFIVEK